MRAIFKPDFTEKDLQVELDAEQSHHLHVVRAKIGENILVINGKGLKASAEITMLEKRVGLAKILETKSDIPKHHFSLAIACPKKDAFEEIIKIAVELGIQKIYPLESQFSQYKYNPNERLDKIIENALVQSNNLFFPKIMPQVSIAEFLNKVSTPLVYFCSHKLEEKKIALNATTEIIILIGPEAGFSSVEEEMIARYSAINQIHLPTAIMRAPTAVAASVGYLISYLK